MEAISHAGICVGILAKDGIVLAVERKITSKLLENISSEKMYKVLILTFLIIHGSSPCHFLNLFRIGNSYVPHQHEYRNHVGATSVYHGKVTQLCIRLMTILRALWPA